ncbi:rRNA-binding ribosome biosynthesis protein utp25 [Podila epicladia]|nr:rRNA-binding ribosome biosynthesis protein utp25 [Podila epicladia]
MEDEDGAEVEEEVATLTEAERKELIKKHGKGYLQALDGEDDDDEDEFMEGEVKPAAGNEEPESSADEEDAKELAEEEFSDEDSVDNFDRHFSGMVTLLLAPKVAVVELAGAKWKSVSYEHPVLKRVEKFDTDNVEGQRKNKESMKNKHDLESLITRDRILRNTGKLQHHQQSPNSSTAPEFRDQGLTRPKVLIILPFKNNVVDVVESLISLSGSTQQDNRKRFVAYLLGS